LGTRDTDTVTFSRRAVFNGDANFSGVTAFSGTSRFVTAAVFDKKVTFGDDTAPTLGGTSQFKTVEFKNIVEFNHTTGPALFDGPAVFSHSTTTPTPVPFAGRAVFADTVTFANGFAASKAATFKKNITITKGSIALEASAGELRLAQNVLIKLGETEVFNAPTVPSQGYMVLKASSDAAELAFATSKVSLSGSLSLDAGTLKLSSGTLELTESSAFTVKNTPILKLSAGTKISIPENGGTLTIGEGSTPTLALSNGGDDPAVFTVSVTDLDMKYLAATTTPTVAATTVIQGGTLVLTKGALLTATGNLTIGNATIIDVSAEDADSGGGLTINTTVILSGASATIKTGTGETAYTFATTPRKISDIFALENGILVWTKSAVTDSTKSVTSIKGAATNNTITGGGTFNNTLTVPVPTP
jgi:lipopolysaccharide export system protein LptA